MTTLWLNPDHALIRSYGGSVNGAKAIVRIEVEVSDHGYLGYLLEDLARAQRELKSHRAEAAAPKKAPGRKAIAHQALLMIPDLREDRS